MLFNTFMIHGVSRDNHWMSLENQCSLSLTHSLALSRSTVLGVKNAMERCEFVALARPRAIAPSCRGAVDAGDHDDGWMFKGSVYAIAVAKEEEEDTCMSYEKEDTCSRAPCRLLEKVRVLEKVSSLRADR